MFPVKYKIKWANDIDYKEEIIYGITFATDGSISSAISNIEEQYGTNNIISLLIYPCDDQPVFEISVSNEDNFFKAD